MKPKSNIMSTALVGLLSLLQFVVAVSAERQVYFPEPTGLHRQFDVEHEFPDQPPLRRPGRLPPPPPPLPPPPPPPAHRQKPPKSAYAFPLSARDDMLIRIPDSVKLTKQSDDNNNGSKNYTSYTIENRLFAEPVVNRCFTSTLTLDARQLEPTFVFVKEGIERRLNASAPLSLIRTVTGFEPRERTIILIHGYTQSFPETEWLRRVRADFQINDALSKYNLIIMDWSTAAADPYPRAAAATSLMGMFLANFIAKLLDLGANRMNIHLIGHSLGAHVAGFAGKRIQPKIGRITALDAAGPCFGKLQSNGPDDRLGPDDAIEVDVYHYDDDFLGLPGQHGQFDVYVNGGASQPGAADNFNSMISALVTIVFRRKKVLSESHTRASEVASINLSDTTCQMVAYQCQDYASFIRGECGFCDDHNNQCYLMNFAYQYGGDTSKEISKMPIRTAYPSKQFYITTKSTGQFCLFHDQVLVKFEPRPELAKEAKQNKWHLHLQLTDESRLTSNLTISNQMQPNTFSFLLTNDKPRLRYVRAKLRVLKWDGSLQPLSGSQSANGGIGPNGRPEINDGSKESFFQVNSIEINYLSNVNSNIRRIMSSRLCPVNYEFRRRSGGEINELDLNSLETNNSDHVAFEECFKH